MREPIKQILLFVVMTFFSWRGAAVVCKEMAPGKWGMQTDQGIYIGSNEVDSYYTTEAHCKKVINETLNEDLVCSWNRKSYQIFNAKSGLALGSASPGAYYSHSSSCGENTKSHPTGTFFCGWTKESLFAPFVRDTNLQIGSPKNGWKTLRDCIQGSLHKARSQLICSWDGNEPQLYDSSGNRLIDFTRQKECDSFIDRLPKNPDQLKQIIDKIVAQKKNDLDNTEAEKLKRLEESKHRLSAAGVKPFCLTLEKGLERGCARNVEMDSQCNDTQKAFHLLSCMTDESKSNLVPEILELPPGGLIPPWVYHVYPLNQIAQTLVYQFHRNIEQPKQNSVDNENPGFDFFKNTSLQMAVNFENLEKISEGGFKNQHETKTSNGYLNREFRLGVENKLIGYQLEEFESRQSRIQKLKPKYAFFVPLVAHSNIDEHNYATGYGNVIIVFKDSLKTRATWTNGDSLTYEKDRNRKVHSFSYATANPQVTKLGKYYEAQIWGTLELSDISHILVNCEGLTSIDRNSIEPISQLFPNTPIFSCKRISERGLTLYTPGRYLKGNLESLENLSVINFTLSSSVELPIDKKIYDLCEGKIVCGFNMSQFKEKGQEPPRNISLEFTCLGRKDIAPLRLSLNDLDPDIYVELKCGEKPEAAAKIPTVIKITEATYGASGEVSSGNVTTPVANYCNNKKACNYKVHPRFIGDPSPRKKKSISIHWKCEAEGAISVENKIDLPIINEGKILEIQCPLSKLEFNEDR